MDEFKKLATLNILLAITSLILVSRFWDTPKFLAGGLAAVTIGLLIISTHRKTDTYLFMAVASLGTAAEWFAISSGAWGYNQTRIITPIWLPILWGIAGIFIANLARGLEQKF